MFKNIHLSVFHRLLWKHIIAGLLEVEVDTVASWDIYSNRLKCESDLWDKCIQRAAICRVMLSRSWQLFIPHLHNERHHL